MRQRRSSQFDSSSTPRVSNSRTTPNALAGPQVADYQALPLPPATPFRALMEQILPGIYAAHPDFAKIDWSTVQWFKSSQPWTPDPDKSLADNGLKHKDSLKFVSPGLTGIQGCYT
mgnify:CR=1 FL=1